MYKCGYRLPIEHSMNQNIQNKHIHTLEIFIYIKLNENESMLNYKKIDELVESYLEKYSGKYLNEMEQWREVSPTIENLGDFFYLQLSELLEKHQYQLVMLEISETPLRTYRVTGRMGE